jgi:hypothetical protein
MSTLYRPPLQAVFSLIVRNVFSRLALELRREARTAIVTFLLVAQ